MRMIDADKLRTKAFVDVDSGEPFIGLQELDEAPTVDAVEVVRCEHCVHSLSDGWICGGPSFTMPSHPTYPDAFCSYGERKYE
jgi:hypothetical protein